MLLCAVLLGFGWRTGGAGNRIVVPGWFVQMPDEPGVLYAVGYARAYATRESSAAEAVQDARQRLRHARQMRIAGEQLFQTLPQGDVVYRGERFDEIGDSTETHVPVILDTVWVGDMVIALAASHASGIKNNRGGVAWPSRPPAWITALPTPRTTLYALGVAPVYFYEEDSWLEAEQQGRHALAFSCWTRNRQLIRAAGGEPQTVTAVATAVQLRAVQIMARWRSDTLCFVLVRAEDAVPDNR